MNNHQKRLIIGLVIAISVLTMLLLLLTKTPLTLTAYAFSLLAPLTFFGTLGLAASGAKNQYITRAAFPFQTGAYGILNLLICVIFVLAEKTGVWCISAGWFAFMQILLLAIFSWRILAMDAGQEEIEQTGKQVKVRTMDWKLLVSDAQEIYQKAGPDCKSVIGKVCETVRYADPMTDENLTQCTEEIHINLQELGKLAARNQREETEKLAEILQSQIKQRNIKCKMLK